VTDTVRVVGAPTDDGASRRGVDMGPSAIRYAGLAAALSELGFDMRDGGGPPVARVDSDDPGRADDKHPPAIESVCTHLADGVSTALATLERVVEAATVQSLELAASAPGKRIL
jgi:arginase